MVRQLRQVAGVDSVKIVDFKRGIFGVKPQRGVRLSEGALLAAARRSGFQPDRVVPPGSSSQPRPSAPLRTDGVEAAGEQAAARAAFRQGNYDEALKLARQVAEKPQPSLETTEPKNDKRNARDVEVQQFLSLVYFALGKYQDAASAAHTALHRGKHWNWKTLGGHYKKTPDYSSQLRALEKSIRQESTPEKRFLVAYHYLMLGQPKAARAQFERVAKAKPDDELVTKLLRDLEKEISND